MKLAGQKKKLSLSRGVSKKGERMKESKVFLSKEEGCRKAYRKKDLPENTKLPMPLCPFAVDSKCVLGGGDTRDTGRCPKSRIARKKIEQPEQLDWVGK